MLWFNVLFKMCRRVQPKKMHKTQHIMCSAITEKNYTDFILLEVLHKDICAFYKCTV